VPPRRQRSWLFLACALAGGAACAGELEQRLMDDLLQTIGDPGLARETRILTRLGRLYIEGRPVPAYDAGGQAVVPFARPWWKPVSYTTRPAANEPAPAPAIAACPGESEPFTFSFYAARDARVEHVRVTPPAGAGGPLPVQPRLYRERHIFVAPQADLRVFRPFALEPVTQAVPLLSNVTTRFWVDLAVPADAAPGLYTGRVEVATDAGPFAIPYTLEVHPFTLRKPLPTEMAWGFWFPPPRDADARRRHLRLMAECGISTFAFQNWSARVDPRGEVALETADMDAALADARAAGLTGPYLIGIGLGEFPGSGAEYSAGWRTRYTRALRLFEQHLAGQGVPYAGLVFDEPRETNIRPCNRNREQMLLYLDLIDRAVPGLRTMVNPMSDEASPAHPDGFYTVFAERPDIVMPHFWARSSNLIARARQRGRRRVVELQRRPQPPGLGPPLVGQPPARAHAVRMAAQRPEGPPLRPHPARRLRVRRSPPRHAPVGRGPRGRPATHAAPAGRARGHRRLPLRVHAGARGAAGGRQRGPDRGDGMAGAPAPGRPPLRARGRLRG
jgi:hypothetical protein